MRKKLLWIISFLCFIFLSSQTSWGFLFSDLPLPSGTRLIQREKFEVEGQEQQLSFYETNLGPKEVLGFYKRHLTQRDYNVLLEQERTIIFMKQNQMLIVAVIPSAVPGKTQFTITDVRVPERLEQPLPVICQDIPGIPVYPGAKCMRSVEMRKGKVRGVNYMTEALIEDVLDFYRIRMPESLWKLEQERDLSEFLSQKENFLKNETNIFSLRNAKILLFKGIKNQRCTIMIMDAPIGRGTLINIVYEEETDF